MTSLKSDIPTGNFTFLLLLIFDFLPFFFIQLYHICIIKQKFMFFNYSNLFFMLLNILLFCYNISKNNNFGKEKIKYEKNVGRTVS